MSAVAQPAPSDHVEHYADPPISLQTFVWAVGALCRIHRVPFESKLLVEQFPPPYTLASLQQAVVELGLTVRLCYQDISALQPESFPCILMHRVAEQDDSASKDEDNRESTPDLVLAVRSDGDRILYFEPSSDTPHTEGVDVASRHFECFALVVRPADAPPPRG